MFRPLLLPSSGCKFVGYLYIMELNNNMKPRISMAKAAMSRKKAFFTSKLDLILRKKLVNCCIWGIAMYGAGTGHFGK